MIRVDNKKTVYSLANKEYKANKKSNFLTIFAVMLTCFMLSGSFWFGISYQDALHTRNVRQEGLLYNMKLLNPTVNQIQIIRQMGNVRYAGQYIECAATDHTKLYWCDETNWEKQSIPAFKWFEGRYPVLENEVMLSTSALNKLEINQPEMGMTIKLQLNDDVEKEMTLSGYFEDASGDLRGFVSQDFRNRWGTPINNYLLITLKNLMFTWEDLNDFKIEIGLGQNQFLQTDYRMREDLINVGSGLLGLILMIVVSGCLFVYNTLNISISRNVRYYGQLKTLGMTRRQIRKCVYLQVAYNAGMGIILGVLAAIVILPRIIPAIVQYINPSFRLFSNNISLWLPLFLAGLCSMATVVLGTVRPAAIAGNMTPVEAARYTGHIQRKRGKHYGASLSGMAFRNIFRSRQQAAVTLLSFMTALTAFLCISVSVNGNSGSNILRTLSAYDFQVLNSTIAWNEPRNSITEDKINQIKSLPGVDSVYTVFSASAVVPYNGGWETKYFEQLFALPYISGSYEENLDAYIKNPDLSLNRGRLIGIDEIGFDKLKGNLSENVDKDAFMNGENCIILSFIDLTLDIPKGSQVEFQVWKDSSSHTLDILAVCDGQASPATYSGGYGPGIIVSDKYLSRLLSEPVIEQVRVDYSYDMNAGLDKAIKDIFIDDEFIIFSSSWEGFNEMRQSDDQMKLMGLAMGILLAGYALMNYINMLASSIQERTREFTALACLGMTQKQMLKMLSYEGLLYGCISLSLSLITALPVSYGVFKLLSRRYMPYQLPWLQTLIVAGFVMIICIFIPPLLYLCQKKEQDYSLL